VSEPLEEPPRPALADGFWIHEGVERATRPRLERPQSISLGYIGDEPLSGGVTRDTPYSPPRGRYTWHEYMRGGSWRR
jgi:hypothetical protein